MEAPNAGNPNRGAYLGLFTCANIIEKHNGHIEVDGGPGRGATFTITLPC